MSKNKPKTLDLERCMSEAEKEQALAKNGLVPKPGHETQPKWVALKGTRNCKSLGKPKYYSHKAIFTVEKITHDWVKEYEEKPNEPNSYAIPADKIDDFNKEILIKRF